MVIYSWGLHPVPLLESMRGRMGVPIFSFISRRLPEKAQEVGVFIVVGFIVFEKDKFYLFPRQVVYIFFEVRGSGDGERV